MRALLALFALLMPLAAWCAPAPAAAPGSRIALVIGNASYKDSPLINPVNDARALGKSLREAGFDVIEVHNQSAAAMRRAIRDFGEKLRGKDAGLFYFAGHGVQVRGRNFLMPVDADIKYEDEIEDQSVDVSLVLGKMESAKARVSLVVLDACRNNPYARSSRSGQNGLAQMDAPVGTLIAFATSPGQAADDGLQGNGLFTRHLVREMREPGLKVEDVFKRVRGGVRAASNGRQIPWESTSLEGDFYFYPPVVLDTAAIERERRRQQEEAIQQAVASAVSRSREEAEREKKRLEQFYAEKLEEDRAAFRKEALERIAALERTAIDAAKPGAILAANAPAPATAVAALAAPLQVPRPVDPAPPRPEAVPPPATTARPAEPQPEPVTTAGAPALELPASFQLALGIDSTNFNKLKPVPDDVARGLKPAQRLEGDRWVYYRTIRDGEGVERRNYLTQTVTFASEAGFTTELSDSPEPWRFDADGNRFSGYYGSGNRLIFDPVNPVYRFPLVAGQSWDAKTREPSQSVNYDVDSKITVVGPEEVTVPAGTFKAIKISKVSNRAWEPFPGQHTLSKRVTNVWYVPALRNFAKAEGLEVTSRGVVILDQSWELDFFELR